ncbi:hypothetical protein LJC49_00585, partial [Ruminococcaceae bacterium OttesenSCG-928-I18]|nr:hypothetical protein [Ruminococcaceae bacterium OttesenSCG-928-I18]
NPKQRRAAEAQRRNRTKALESEIAALEQAVKEGKAALENPENGSDYALLAALGTQLEDDTAKLDTLTEEWLLLTDESMADPSAP